MVAPITVKLNADEKDLIDGLKGASKSIKIFGQDVGVGLSPKMAIATSAIKLGAKALKTVGGAAKDAAAEEQIFQDVMAKATGKHDDYNESLDGVIDASGRLAFTDTETRKALASLTTATGDAGTATDLLAGAQDIARMAGVDLETASDAVAKAYAGQDTALLRMLPGLEKGASGMDTIKNATNLAEGAALTYADSAQATGDKAKIAFSEIAETLGTLLVPVLEAVGDIIRPIAQVFGELVRIILPPLERWFDRLARVLGRVADVLQRVADMISRVIDKIRELLDPLTDAVGKMRELLPGGKSFGGGGAPAVVQMAQVASFGVDQQLQKNGSGGVTINIYGDPSVIEARVTKALRDYARRNGAASIFTPERT